MNILGYRAYREIAFPNSNGNVSRRQCICTFSHTYTQKCEDNRTVTFVLNSNLNYVLSETYADTLFLLGSIPQQFHQRIFSYTHLAEQRSSPHGLRLLLIGGSRGSRATSGGPHLLGLLGGRGNVVLPVLHNLKVANAIVQLPLVAAGDLLESVEAHQTNEVDLIEILVDDELGLLGLGAEGGGLGSTGGGHDKGRSRGGDESKGGADGGLHFYLFGDGSS